jgi:hypothetical protein
MSAADDLTDALGRLEIELSCADDQALTDGLAALARFRIRSDAVWLKAVAEVDRRGLHRRHGSLDAASWLAGLAGDRRGAARRDVELAKQLEDAPAVADAVAAGAVSRAKAAELLRGKDLPDDVQELLISGAAAQAVEEVANAVERARLAHGEHSAPPPRELTITRRADHARIEGTVDLVDAEILDVALSTMADASGLPVEMPYSERRAHALVGLARFYVEHQRAVPSGRLGRPHIVVLVDLETLEARAGGSALLASGAVIEGDQARRLAEDATISRVITSGRSEPLDVGRSTRSVPPALAKAVIVRDRHCRYRGCAAPPWACDVHHREPWARGGPTAVHNLGLLCWHHHEHVHRRGADHLVTTPDGRWMLDLEADAVAA